MPGHFTHIYTARRVSDLLLSGEFTDWPDLGGAEDGVRHYDPRYCGEIMQRWEKFTAIGVIGPDLFFFSEDWNSDLVGPHSDQIMLALATYYFFDAAFEDQYEPLLIILEEVNATMAAIIRFLLKLQRIWDDFVAAWNKTIGPLVDAASEILDDLTGGVLSQFQTALNELLLAIKEVGIQEIATWKDIWGLMNTVVQKGWSEDSFLWSDMTHYRRTSATCEALVKQAEALRDDTPGGGDRFEQFLAFSLGWMTHLGTDAIAHSFVNEQCGGPYRDHPTRHHLIENHIDAWNYQQSGEGGTIPTDPWGKTADYPELSMSALWFLVQQTPDEPQGEQRPSPLSDDPDERKGQLDVDGEMPGWMAESIVKAMIDTFENHPHPKIYLGDAFQQQIDQGLLTNVIRDVTGHGLDRPFQELLDGIAPPPSFPVPKGFPLPWEVATAYRFMITMYKLNFSGSWELSKPRVPDFIIVPPASDITNLFQPPDFSGVNGDNPIEDVCDVFIALVEWIVKEVAAAIKLAGDIIKMLVSPNTYAIRLALYELAMRIWDVAMKTHDVMAHTGILLPHGEQRYENGELRLPNEIDLPLITLGGTVDGAFLQALADAIDPLGNLDQTQSVIVSHSVRDGRMPFYPVLQYHANGHRADDYEYHRPWAYPLFSEFEDNGQNSLIITPTETYDPSKSDDQGPSGSFKPMRPGPYPERTTPDQVFFRTDGGVDVEGRGEYESAQSPWQTDLLNERFIGKVEEMKSPLGDPVPFSAYLIGRLVNPTDYQTQFNLDADRAYGYLTWDWIRGEQVGTAGMGIKYTRPLVPPENDDGTFHAPGEPDFPPWDNGVSPMQLRYVDPPPPPVIILLREGEGADVAVEAGGSEGADASGDRSGDDRRKGGAP